MNIPAKQPEVTINFSTRPDCPDEGKTFTLELTGEKGIKVRAELNRKNFRKQAEKMDSFSEWVAALSGKIAQILPDGTIELEGAGVNVFEKVSKNPEPQI